MAADVTGAVGRAWRRAAGRADRLDASGAGVVARQAWGLTRLAGLAVALPVVGPVVLATAVRNTARALRDIDAYPARLDELLGGGVGGGAPAAVPPSAGAQRVDRVPAAARWFVASDLHRCVPGTVDWPATQDTRRLYEVALDHYAGGSWGLIENGDVEDFWLAGGSAYGVVYDVTRLVGHVVRGPGGRRLLAELSAEHLRRIVANNRGVYDRIEDGFHRHGRYRRIVGNHDDVFLDPEVVAALGTVHPGIEVLDALVLDDGGTGVGVVTHGHDLDAWNAPGRAGLGKFGTWFGSALLDAPVGGNPGIADEDETATIVEGRLPGHLTRVSRLLGANRELYSLDEILLFEACRRRWAPGALHLDEGPWLLLGHTHLPLRRPVDPSEGGRWERYVNGGSGIFAGCITGIEWDGTADPRSPDVRLVLWRYARPGEVTDDATVVGEIDGRPVVREVLDRPASTRSLAVVDRGPVPEPAGRGAAGRRASGPV